MIIALPKETYDTFADGISLTIEEGQYNRIQFGNLSHMPNAPQADPAYMKKYRLTTQNVRAVIFHGEVAEDPDGIYESEDLVIETSTMSREDWVKTRVFCWMTSFCIFDKVFSIPLILLHRTTGISYRRLIEALIDAPEDEFPTLAETHSFFTEKARSIQNGGIEYCPAPEWLNIYWPVDEYVFIKLCKEGRLDGFYQEATEALLRFFRDRNVIVDDDLLLQAVLLNKMLLKLPFVSGDITLHLSYNILEFWKAVRCMEPIPLLRNQYAYRIDRTSERWKSWEEWYRYVVWYENKKGAYLHDTVKEDIENPDIIR